VVSIERRIQGQVGEIATPVVVLIENTVAAAEDQLVSDVIGEADARCRSPVIRLDGGPPLYITRLSHFNPP
jgi:hypothetical protein